MAAQDSPIGEESAFYSPADLQKRWRVSRSLVYKLINSADFPDPLKLGSALRFARDDVHAWEERNTRSVHPPPEG